MDEQARHKRIQADVARLLPTVSGWTADSNCVLSTNLWLPSRLVDFSMRRKHLIDIEHRCKGRGGIMCDVENSTFYCPHCAKEWTGVELRRMTVETMEREFLTSQYEFVALYRASTGTPEPWPEKLDWFETKDSMHMAPRPMTVEEVLYARVAKLYGARAKFIAEFGI
jgi:hypothetical protein